MSLKKTLGSFALVAAVAAGSTGCVVRARGHVSAPVAYVEVEEEPPPPRAVIVETRPGYVYVQGRWDRRGGQWIWMDGRWDRERAGYRWDDGRWERRGRGHVWVEGRWSAGGGGRVNNGPQVRDHRSDPPPPPPQQGPVIRDHR